MPLPTEPIVFSQLRIAVGPTWGEAFWHACCNVEWVPRYRRLRYDQHALRSNIYFLNPRNEIVGEIRGTQV